jgi:predicted O-methyltransferase YrrM
MTLHPETWMESEQLGRFYPEYQKTYDFPGNFIDQDHRELHTTSVNGMLAAKIKGRLREADALKLYEMAYFSDGPILEIGTYHGLSSSIMAAALKNAKSTKRIISVDLNKGLSDLAHRNLASLALEDFVTFETDDGTSYLSKAATDQKRFAFVFVDHSHEYAHVKEAARRLHGVTTPAGFVLFHDFNDPRNVDPERSDYGVYDGVIDGLDRREFQFAGTYGCACLFQRRPLQQGVQG